METKWAWMDLGLNPALPLISFVTLGKLLISKILRFCKYNTKRLDLTFMIVVRQLNRYL